MFYFENITFQLFWSEHLQVKKKTERPHTYDTGLFFYRWLGLISRHSGPVPEHLELKLTPASPWLHYLPTDKQINQNNDNSQISNQPEETLHESTSDDVHIWLCCQ